MGTLTDGRPSLLVLAALVAAGGAVGTAVRALLEHAWPATPGGWPWTTFAINLVGSFALGALLETLARSGPDAGRRRVARLVVGTGVLGGFTTYSTFVVEVERRLSGGFVATGVAYALTSVVLGLVAAWLGVVAAGALRRATSAAAGS